jgi:hypothetical protein
MVKFRSVTDQPPDGARVKLEDWQTSQAPRDVSIRAMLGRPSLALGPGEFGTLTLAERQLLAGVGNGEEIVIGDGALPPPGEAAQERRIRAGFIRHLICNTLDAPHRSQRPHEKGIRIAGAAIDGCLDLQGCTVTFDLSFRNCHFSCPLVFDSARVEGLRLNGSVLPGLRAEWFVARGAVSLDGVQATGELRLVGAKIGGQLDCDNLRVSNPGKNALALMRIEVGGALFLRGTASIDGVMNLLGARFHRIVDAAECWPKPGDLKLSGCVYDSFLLGAPVSAAARLRWLRLQYAGDCSNDFSPQPFEQCALVLREMGHVDDARVILIEKERLLRRAVRERARSPLRQALWLKDCLLGGTIRYGHAPMLALAWLLGFWVLGMAVYGFAYEQRAFRPHISLLRRPEWLACAGDAQRSWSAASLRERVVGRALPGESQLDCFLRQPEAQTYPRFNAVVYALDTLLPVVSLGMDDSWSPDQSKPWGHRAQVYQWFQILIGWALTFLTVSGFSGLVKSK